MEGKADELHLNVIPWSNAFRPGLTPFCPPMWQAEADTELTLSASPTTVACQKALALAKRRYSTVVFCEWMPSMTQQQSKEINFSLGQKDIYA